jgi:uncharacterized coiled-coil DUF342 family protein
MPYKRAPLPATAGLHRYYWDLRHDGARLLRGAKIDSGHPNEGVLVKPGRYTLKLTVEGKERTQALMVLPDPRVKMTPREYAEEEKFALKVRDDINHLTDVVTRLRQLREQVRAREELLGDGAKTRELVEAGRALVKKLDALEERLHNPRAKTIYDILAHRGGAKLYSQMAWVFEQLKDSDGPITQGMREVYEEQVEVMKKYDKEWADLLNEDVARLNELAKKAGVPGVLVPPVGGR